MAKRLDRAGVEERLRRNFLDCVIAQQGDAFVVTVVGSRTRSADPTRDLARAAFVDAGNVTVSDDVHWFAEES